MKITNIEFKRKLEDFTKKMKDIKIVKQKINEQQQEELANKILIGYPIFFETTLSLNPRNSLNNIEILLEIVGMLIEA